MVSDRLSTYSTILTTDENKLNSNLYANIYLYLCYHQRMLPGFAHSKFFSIYLFFPPVERLKIRQFYLRSPVEYLKMLLKSINNF